MAQNYIISTITNAGRDAIQTALTGGYTLMYKHMVIGDGTYTVGEDVRSRTALKSPKTVYPFNSQTPDTMGVRLKSVITNADGTTPITQEAYNINEVGIVVTVNGTDYLYAIAAVEGNTGTLLPVYDGINKTEIVQTWYCVNSNDLDVTVTMTGAYALADDMTSAQSDIAALDGRLDTVEADIISLDGRITAHSGQSVRSQTGIHGIRFYNEELQIYNETTEEWEDVSGGGGVYPLDVSGVTITPGSGKLTISWEDAGDLIVDDTIVSHWDGTKLVMKQGAYPTSVLDGTQVVDNKVKDQYKTNGFTITGLTNDTTYYFQLFPYSDEQVYNNNVANRFTGTPVKHRMMTAVIDLTNSNPETSITYADDAVNMTPGSSDWDEFFGHYPVMLLNGVEGGKLNPNNFAEHEDGTAADITSGAEGDVMIAFPRRGVKITTSSDGNTLTVSMTDSPDDPGFTYYAHTRGNVSKNKFYLGAYKGYESSSKLRSLSGKTITTNKTIDTFRTLAQANGSGYENSGFYQLIFRQVMYILKYKNLDSQTTLGRGNVDNSSSSSPKQTGGTNTKGMDFGETTGKLQMKLFGLEDFWGNIYEWIDGIYCDSNRHILTATDGFNDSGNNYTDQGQGASANLSNYMSKPQGTSETGFVAKEVSGSATTYFCDYGTLYAVGLAAFGGDWDDASYAGAFPLVVYSSASAANSDVGGRLMYL